MCLALRFTGFTHTDSFKHQHMKRDHRTLKDFTTVYPAAVRQSTDLSAVQSETLAWAAALDVTLGELISPVTSHSVPLDSESCGLTGSLNWHQIKQVVSCQLTTDKVGRARENVC